ncbi:MAG: hypothetical protein WCR21_12225, partial [Bacteroidota bacterium]
MKTYFSVCLILIFLSQRYIAQNPYICGNINQSTNPSTVNSAGPCDEFLNAFKPLSSEPTLTLNAIVYIYAPSINSITGVWTYSDNTGDHQTSDADVYNAFACVNAKLAALSPTARPTPSVGGMWNYAYPQLSDTKITFKVTQIHRINNTYLY